MIFRVLFLIVGIYACSTSVIFIRKSQVHPVLMAGYRQLIAAVVLAPVFLRDLRRSRGRYTGAHFRRSLLPGAVLGVHFITWIVGARMAWAANATLIVNMVPIAMPFLLYALVREQLTPGEWVGTGVALAGVGVMAAADYRVGGQYFAGDTMCFVSMLLFALYLALGRRNRDFPTIWLYVVPVYFVGGVVCLAVSLPFVHPLDVRSAKDVWMIVGLGIVPTVTGHSILNYSMKRIRGQAVSIANLSQFIFAGTMAYFLLDGEIPKWTFYPACVLAVAGAALALRSTPERKQ